MLSPLAAFAALSMAGTLVLSLLPDGGIKQTAAMAISLLTLLCWAEGVCSLLGIAWTELRMTAPLQPTAYSMSTAVQEASSALAGQWEVSP